MCKMHRNVTEGIAGHVINPETVTICTETVIPISQNNDRTATLLQSPTNMEAPAARSDVSHENHINTTTNIGKNIGVWIPSDQCHATLPTQSTFSGVTKQRIARYYIGGIIKSSTETGLRNFLSDREINITHLRFFNRQDRKSASAQINVPVESRDIIESENFWPKGIYVKPWVSKQKFLSQFNNHTDNGSAEY